MSRLTVYLGMHLAFALILAADIVVRLLRRKGGLAEWGNDALLIGLVFIVALTGAMAAMPAEAA